MVDVYIALRRWWWIPLATVMVASIAAVVIAFSLPPTYRSVVVLAPAETLSQDSNRSSISAFGALRSLAGGAQDKGSAEALAILESKRFTGDFIKHYKLMPALFADEIDPVTGKWTSEKRPSLEDGIIRFERDVRGVSTDEETGFVQVFIVSRDADQAQTWARNLVDDLNNEMRDRAIREARADLQFLRDQLSGATLPEIRMSLVGVIREKMETVMLATNRPNYAFKIIDPAFKSKYRYQPQRALIVAVGVLVGVLLSFGIIALAETARQMRLHL